MGGRTRISRAILRRAVWMPRVWMPSCGVPRRRCAVSVPVISPRCTGRGSRAEDRWHCFLCPSRGWDEDEQKLVDEEREGRSTSDRDALNELETGRVDDTWRGRWSNLFNDSKVSGYFCLLFYNTLRLVDFIFLRKWEIDFWKIREFSGYLLPREWDWYLERVKIGDNIGYVCVVIPIIIISISNSTLEINSVAIIITPLFQTYSVSSQKSS